MFNDKPLKKYLLLCWFVYVFSFCSTADMQFSCVVMIAEFVEQGPMCAIRVFCGMRNEISHDI